MWRADRQSYYVKYRDERGRWRRVAVGSDLEEALREHRRLRGEPLDEPAFDELAERWLEDLKLRAKPSTVRNGKYKLRILKRFFGGRALPDLGPSDYQAYLASRTREVRPASVNSDQRVLKAILRRGRELGFYEKLPFRIKMLREPRAEPKTYTARELRRVLGKAKETDDKVYAFLLIARGTGARYSEILWLQWCDLDLKTGRVHIRPKEGWSPKSHAARTVYLPEEVLPELRKYKMRQLRSGAHDWVFTPDKGRKGERLTTIAKRQRKVFKAARVWKRGKPLSHGIRHSTASELAVEHGVDVETLRDILGHSTITVTQIYMHTGEEAKKRAASKLRI
jgi:integrase